MKYFQGLSETRLKTILEKMKRVKAVLIGDMCLDVYWVADMTKSQLSRETPHFPLPITEERFSAGAGGNVAVNMSMLCDNFFPIGVISDDWRGVCLKNTLTKQGVPTDGLVVVNGGVTNAYCKPMRKGYLGFEVEDPRLDFESFAPLTPQTEDQLIEKLKFYASNADVLCVSDQFENGCITDRVRNSINELSRAGILTVVDSRSRISKFSNCILKPNEIECGRATGIHLSSESTDEDTITAIRTLADKTESEVCLTLGARGCLFYRKNSLTKIDAIPVSPPVDTVGAGDCFLSAFSLALAAGANDREASVIGTLASSICVKKLNTTGSANAFELIEQFARHGE